MKVIFLAGSRKFSDDIERAADVLKDAGFNVFKGRDLSSRSMMIEKRKHTWKC